MYENTKRRSIEVHISVNTIQFRPSLPNKIIIIIEVGTRFALEYGK